MRIRDSHLIAAALNSSERNLTAILMVLLIAGKGRIRPVYRMDGCRRLRFSFYGCGRYTIYSHAPICLCVSVVSARSRLWSTDSANVTSMLDHKDC